MSLRDRVFDFRRVPAADLAPHPKNWKHPKHQQDALRGLLEEIGFADAVLAREGPGKLMLMDGHLRKDLLQGTYHGRVERQHIQSYLNEFCFRRNRRFWPLSAFQTVLRLGMHQGPEEYEDLHAADLCAGTSTSGGRRTSASPTVETGEQPECQPHPRRLQGRSSGSVSSARGRRSAHKSAGQTGTDAGCREACDRLGHVVRVATGFRLSGRCQRPQRPGRPADLLADAPIICNRVPELTQSVRREPWLAVTIGASIPEALIGKGFCPLACHRHRSLARRCGALSRQPKPR